MRAIDKKHMPLLFLTGISIFWGYFYQSSNWLNDYGRAQSEWLLLIDGLIVLPLICFACIADKKEALIKAFVYSCLIVLLGSFVIPESNKFIWHYLESGRYLVLIAFVLLEVITVITVVVAIRASLQKNRDPDLSISEPIEHFVGQSTITKLLSFEARVWTYFLFAKHINKSHFTGEMHFYGDRKDGTQSNLLGFILLMVFEMPIMHLVLHFLWTPLAANIVTVLTLIGLVFFIAEYKAIAIRPVSLLSQQVIIRYGVWNPLTIALSEIKSASTHNSFVRRASHIRRFNLSGHPSVKIELLNGKQIYLGLNTPDNFIRELNKYLAQESS